MKIDGKRDFDIKVFPLKKGESQAWHVSILSTL